MQVEELAGRRAGQDGGGEDLVAWQDEAQGRSDQVGAGRHLDHLGEEVACESGRDRDASERGCGRRRRERGRIKRTMIEETSRRWDVEGGEGRR